MKLRHIITALVGVCLVASVYVIARDPVREVSPSTVRVIDGDTIVVGKEHVRLDDIDAPETYLAHCANEYTAGDRAEAAMDEIIHNAKTVGLERTGTDRYGRTLAHVYVNGWDVSKLMLDAGLALKYAPGWQAHHDRIAHWCGPGNW